MKVVTMIPLRKLSSIEAETLSRRYLKAKKCKSYKTLPMVEKELLTLIEFTCEKSVDKQTISYKVNHMAMKKAMRNYRNGFCCWLPF